LTEDYPERVRALFDQAVDLSPTDQQSFLDACCPGEPDVRARVEYLLACDARLRAEEGAGGLLDSRLVRSPEKANTSPEPIPAPEEQPAFPGATAHPLHRGTLIGPYRLLQPLGEGGMGAVYVAEQTEPVKRRVALKIIKPGLDSEPVIRRFEAERQALALMDHPHIAKVLDAGTTATGQPYFVMELVPGGPITRYCDERCLGLRERLELFVLVCQAVQHAHQKGIIHRDLKPSNVLVAVQDDGQPVPKVIDFGVAKALHQRLTERTLHTEFGVVIGTLEYMSPEQADAGVPDIDTRADLYALGVLLYELLTGTTPLMRKWFKRAAIEEILRAIREEEPPKPSLRLTESKEALAALALQRRAEPERLRREVRGELDWIVMKCLEKDRTRRYETASGLARDLQRYLAGEPVEAGPPGAGYRFRKYARKHRAALGMAGAVVALLVGATGVSFWQAVRATRAETRAIKERDEKEEQRKRADEQAAIATAVNDFLQDGLLRQTDSSQQADRGFRPEPDLTVRTLLDRAAAGIGNRFHDRPVVAAAIRQTIGNAYLSIGAYEQGIQHLSAAKDLRTTHLGPDHPDTLSTLNDLGWAYREAGRTAEAVRLLERLQEQRTQVLGPDHPDTLSTLQYLAGAYRVAGRITDAVQLLERLRQQRTQVLGPDHPDTLSTLHSLTLAYRSVGRTAEAIEILERLRESVTQRFGPDHPHTLITLRNLAEAYRFVGRSSEAIPLFEHVREQSTRLLGPDHPDTLTTLHDLATAYCDAGRTGEAIQLLERVREQRTKQLGPDHPDTLTTLHNLATVHQIAGHVPEAIQLLEQLREQRIEKLGPGHPDTLVTLNNLAGAYRSVGRTAEAIPLYEQVRGHQIRTLGPEHPHTLITLLSLALAYRAAGRTAEAEPLLRESVVIRQKKQPDNWVTFYAKSLLGDSLAGQKKYAEAEPLLLSGYEGLKQRARKLPPRARPHLTEALEQLVQLYDAWGQKDQAAKWRKELEATKVEAKKGKQEKQP
jgi:serine/threonine protein kinase